MKPELVAEVEFTEWTHDGRLRHPSFKGLREDKAARRSSASGPRIGSQSRVGDPRGGGPARQERRAQDGRRRGGRRPDHATRTASSTRSDGVTKAAVARYYAAVADHMLPHLRSRPATLVRCPEGLRPECFYQKHPGPGRPRRSGASGSARRGRTDDYLVIEDVAGLVGLVQMGVLEIHTWNAQADAARDARPGRLRPRSRPGRPLGGRVVAAPPRPGEARGAWARRAS